jgi:hypothetical protein
LINQGPVPPIDLIREIEFLRKEVNKRDRKMFRMNIDMQKLRKENHSL